MAITKEKIYKITNGNNSITFFRRTVGHVGRDIAAVKRALGEIYYAPVPNTSPEDNTTGEAWFDCNSSSQLSVEELLTFTKKFKRALISFQMQYQFMILSYYFETYYSQNIKQNDEESLYRQIQFMSNSFEVEFGTIGEATVAILHGWRPTSNASNRSFITSDQKVVDKVPKLLYDSYQDGTISPLPSGIIEKISLKEDPDFEEASGLWDSTVSQLRNWSGKVPSIEFACVEYKSDSYIGNVNNSKLYDATQEILSYAETATASTTDELTPSQREKLISRAFEPDYLLDPDPFIISTAKIGFFDRTDYTFRSLPEFENLSTQTRQSLENAALVKVLGFYRKAPIEGEYDPRLINFIDFRVPSLRPGDVYRAYFEVNKNILDSLPNLAASAPTDPNLEVSSTSKTQKEELEQELSELYCADGGALSDEEAQAQYERYRAFAAKKKLEITRKLRQAAIQKQEDDLNIDGVEVDLGIFGKGSLSESEIQQLIADGGTWALEAVGNLAAAGFDKLIDTTSMSTSGNLLDGEGVTFSQLKKLINTVADRFEEAAKDLENFELSGDAYFNSVQEANKLRKIPGEFARTFGGDVSAKEFIVSTLGSNQTSFLNHLDTKIYFYFSDVPNKGSLITKISTGNTKLRAGPFVNFDNEAKTENISDTQGQNVVEVQEGAIGGVLKNPRTVHYLRNIKDLASRGDALGSFLGAIVNPESVCNINDNVVGTAAEYVLKYTKGVEVDKKSEFFNPVHNWKRSSTGTRAIDQYESLKNNLDKRANTKAYGLVDVQGPKKLFGFEEALPVLGPPIDTTSWESATDDFSQKMLKEISSLVDYKRLMCEYAKCLGLPDVQLKLPDLTIPKLPDLPALPFPDFTDGSGEKYMKLLRDILYRAVYTFLKGIIDILKTPFCGEKFVEDLYGAAENVAPDVQKALADGFLDTGVPINKKQNAKDLIDSLLTLLTPAELCALLNGEIVNDAVYHICRAVAEQYNLKEELETEEQISNFFLTLGVFVGPELCENLTKFSPVLETCEDIYSVIGQMRNAILKGEDVTAEKLEAASAAAEEQFRKKTEALNFLSGEGGLSDLIPDLNSLENNPLFSTPSVFLLDGAKKAAQTSLGLPKTAFVSSLNTFVPSFYIDAPRLAGPGDENYDAQSAKLAERATCNLQRFAKFSETDLDLSNLSNRDATDSLRRALLILSDDYEVETIVNESGDSVEVYGRNAINPQQSAILLKGSLVEKYELDTVVAANLGTAYEREIKNIFEYIFPISTGDLQGSTKTISNIIDWHKPIFRGDALGPTDILTLNTNYLNKMNQIISKLQQDISQNMEKAFGVTNSTEFLASLIPFYDVSAERDRPTIVGELISAIDNQVLLKHPVLPARNFMVRRLETPMMPIGEKILIRDTYTIKDSFLLGPNNTDNLSMQECTEVPQELVSSMQSVTSLTYDEAGEDQEAGFGRPRLFQSIWWKKLKEHVKLYPLTEVVGRGAARLIEEKKEDLQSVRAIEKELFPKVQEGIMEQLVSEIADSRVFNDTAYINRLDAKLKSSFYYDPGTQCYRNPNNLIKFGALNFDELIANEFEEEYKREYAKPENSTLLRDYSKPGAFEKAMMNTIVRGFVKICLVDLLLKGSVPFSVWDFDFVKGDKLYRDYLYHYVNKQIEKQKFFQDHRDKFDETLIRIAANNNVCAALRKIIMEEVDTTISDLSKNIFENDGNMDYSKWFLDNIPFVSVPKIQVPGTDGEVWVSELDPQEMSRYSNPYSYLENYIRIRGSLRSFSSSKSEIARAQLLKLNERMADLEGIVRETNLELPPIDRYGIGSESSIDINMYDDNDNYPDRELVSVEEFSEIIRSLLDNNKGLSEFFHQMQRKIYSPNDPVKHSLPETLEDRFPHRPIIRRRRRFEFKNANIFSSLYSIFSDYRDDLPDTEPANRSNSTLASRQWQFDKFKKMSNEYTPQNTDSAVYCCLVSETPRVRFDKVVDTSESSISNLIQKSFENNEEYEERYYISETSLDEALQTSTKAQFNTTIPPNMEQDELIPLQRFSEDTLGVQFRHKVGESDGNTLSPGPEKRGIFASRETLKPSGPFDLRERDQVQSTSTGVRANLFENKINQVNKEYYESFVNSELAPPEEIWEETIIDLVEAASPIFNKPGHSEFEPKFTYNEEQKQTFGKRLNRQTWFLTEAVQSRFRKSTGDHPDKDRYKYLFTAGSNDVGDGSAGITRARPVGTFGQIIHHGFIDNRVLRGSGDYTSTYHWDRAIGRVLDSHTENTSQNVQNPTYGLKRVLDYTFASNDVKLSKLATPGESGEKYGIDSENDILLLNDYKVPLRLLITQVKNPEGKVLKTFVKYVIPKFCTFNNYHLSYCGSPESTRPNELSSNLGLTATAGITRDLDPYRTDLLQEASKEIFQGYERFVKESFRKIMISKKESDPDTYNDYKSCFYEPQDPENSDIRVKRSTAELVENSMVNGPIPLMRYPGNYRDDNGFSGNTLEPSWFSTSKLYSVAAQIEARKKQNFFSTSTADLDRMFSNPGKLLRKPVVGTTASEYENLLPPTSEEAATRGEANPLRANRLHYKLQETYLYEDSMHDLLGSITGTSPYRKMNPNTKILQTIGNLVSWFNQRRTDAFWGYTSGRINKKGRKELMYEFAGIEDFSVDNPLNDIPYRTDPAPREILEPNFQNYETPSYAVGPSLFYFDSRGTSLNQHFMLEQDYGWDPSTGTTNGDLARLRNSISAYYETDLKIGGLGGRRVESLCFIDDPDYSFASPGGSIAPSISDTRSVLSSAASGKDIYPKRTSNIPLVWSQNRYPSERYIGSPQVSHPGYALAKESISGRRGAPLPLSTLNKLALARTAPDETLPEVWHNIYPPWRDNNGGDATRALPGTLNFRPNDAFNVVMDRFHIDNSEQETKRGLGASNVVNLVSTRYNSALDETGVTNIIRDVTTTYTTNLEQDRTIINDIIEDSDITYGIRIMLGVPMPENANNNMRNIKDQINEIWHISTAVAQEERLGNTVTEEERQVSDLLTFPISSYEYPLGSLQCFQAENVGIFNQKILEMKDFMKCKLKEEDDFQTFFNFTVPYNKYATMLTIHGTGLLAGYGDMPTIFSSTKSGLASIFSTMADINLLGEDSFGGDFDEADLISAFGPLGPVGGQDIDCFDLPNVGQWWELVKETLKQYAKYFPSIVLRGIADSIDPAYKEMKRHYLACEIQDLRIQQVAFRSGDGNTPLGLRGGERGKKKYASMLPSLPVDLGIGLSRLPNPNYLLKSIDKLIGYIYGGPLPLLDPTFAFKIPCKDVDIQTPSDWSDYTVGNSGRYGHPMSLFTLLALSTHQLPGDIDLKNSICITSDLPENPGPCEDEIE